MHSQAKTWRQHGLADCFVTRAAGPLFGAQEAGAIRPMPPANSPPSAGTGTATGCTGRRTRIGEVLPHASLVALGTAIALAF